MKQHRARSMAGNIPRGVLSEGQQSSTVLPSTWPVWVTTNRNRRPGPTVPCPQKQLLWSIRMETLGSSKPGISCSFYCLAFYFLQIEMVLVPLLKFQYEERKNKQARIHLVAHSRPTLCNSMDWGSPGSLSMGFSRQDWSGLPFPSPGHLPDPGFKPTSPTLKTDLSPLSRQGRQKGRL